MARFGRKKKKNPLQVLLSTIVLFVALIAIFLVGINSIGSGTSKRQKEALESAITRYITECYAEEGHYPESVLYMIENYGLRFNEDRFYVDYHIRGTNNRPDFTVVVRGEDDE